MVQEPAASERGLVVHELADLTEGEVVGGLVRRGALLHETPRHQLVEAGHRLVVAAAAGGADDVEGERSADDRRGREQLGGAVGQRGQAARAAGHRRRPGRPRPPASGVEVRDDQERQALALADHLLGRPGPRRRRAPRRRPARRRRPRDSRPSRMATPAPSRSRSPSARESGPESPTSPLRWVTIRHGPSSPPRCTRWASTCWVASSAHCTSSTTSTPGGAPPAAATARAMPSRNRASRAGPVDRRRLGVGRAELRDQPGRLARDRRRERGRARRAVAGSATARRSRSTSGPVGHVAVVVVAARHQRRAVQPRDDLLDETGLAHARLALDHDDATGTDRGEQLPRPRRRDRRAGSGPTTASLGGSVRRRPAAARRPRR